MGREGGGLSFLCFERRIFWRSRHSGRQVATQVWREQEREKQGLGDPCSRRWLMTGVGMRLSPRYTVLALLSCFTEQRERGLVQTLNNWVLEYWQLFGMNHEFLNIFRHQISKDDWAVTLDGDRWLGLHAVGPRDTTNPRFRLEYYQVISIS